MYTLYVDESGEAGIENIRSEVSENGASPFMTLGGAIVKNADLKIILDKLEALTKDFNKKDLHCNRLDHFQKIKFAQEATQMPMAALGVISRKETLGSYKEHIGGNSRKYYNKCAQYLLERAGMFAASEGIDPKNLRIVFEKGNFDYERLRNFIAVCQRSPRHPNTKYLRNLLVENISEAPKSEEPALQLADLVAHCLYKCVDSSKRSWGNTEPRYAWELRNAFFARDGIDQKIGESIYAVHSLEELKLSPAEQEPLQGF